MTNPFQTIPPVRIRFESAAISVDATGPCALVIIPARDGSGQLEVLAQHHNPAQLAAMVEVAIRFAILQGVTQQVFAGLAAPGMNATMIQRTTPAPGTTPRDDVPPHLRG